MRSRRLPGNLDQAIFRIGAFAFCSLSTLALLTDHLGPGLQNAYPLIWGLTALAYTGGALAWYLAHRRAPVELILPLALLGIGLIPPISRQPVEPTPTSSRSMSCP